MKNRANGQRSRIKMLQKGGGGPQQTHRWETKNADQVKKWAKKYSLRMEAAPSARG